MSEKYQRPDYIRVVKAVCVEFGNNDDTWTWCYLDVREALTKAKELLMKLEPDERLVVGTAYCGQNLRVGEILELVPAEDYLLRLPDLEITFFHNKLIFISFRRFHLETKQQYSSNEFQTIRASNGDRTKSRRKRNEKSSYYAGCITCVLLWSFCFV